MIATVMLFAAQVIAAQGNMAVVRSASNLEVGQRLGVQRLEHAPGAPGRAPFFRWSRTGEARVTAVRPDGMTDVELLSGRIAAGDRVAD